MVDPLQLWLWLPVGYLLTILLETPVLLVGLGPAHSLRRRLLAGLWLTACTYPVVILVLPVLIDPGGQRGLYLAVAETFAPVAECLLFRAAFTDADGEGVAWRDYAAVVLANLFSFAAGEALSRLVDVSSLLDVGGGPFFLGCS